MISHLDAPDAPDKEADTKRLWENIKAGKYGVVLSDLTLIEINKSAEPKRSFMQDCISNIDYEEVMTSDESRRLSSLYLERGGLPPKSKDDALHIAIATAYNCDILLSWNFKHIVNTRTIKGTKAIATMEGFKDIIICTPTMLIEGGTDDE